MSTVTRFVVRHPTMTVVAALVVAGILASDTGNSANLSNMLAFVVVAAVGFKLFVTVFRASPKPAPSSKHLKRDADGRYGSDARERASAADRDRSTKIDALQRQADDAWSQYRDAESDWNRHGSPHISRSSLTAAQRKILERSDAAKERYDTLNDQIRKLKR